ncbi:hypothetical protein LY78DRAFT_672579 [Colletotrichum sublineola]|nr:hypothetical protein LY78DRAFT_672579 [Colletotrichum sublineola]
MFMDHATGKQQFKSRHVVVVNPTSPNPYGRLAYQGTTNPTLDFKWEGKGKPKRLGTKSELPKPLVTVVSLVVRGLGLVPKVPTDVKVSRSGGRFLSDNTDKKMHGAAKAHAGSGFQETPSSMTLETFSPQLTRLICETLPSKSTTANPMT